MAVNPKNYAQFDAGNLAVLQGLGLANLLTTLRPAASGPAVKLSLADFVTLLGVEPLDSDLSAIAALTTTSYGRALLTLADAAALAALVDSFFLTPAEGNAAYQPLDADLTAIAALTTTSFGRSFLALADAAAGRTLLGLGTAATQNTGAFDAAGAAAAAQAASQPLDSDLTAIAALSTTSYGRGLLALANQAALIAEVASAYQPLDSDLTSIAALTTTSYGRAFLALADAAAARAALRAADQILVITTDATSNHALVLTDASPLAYLQMTSGSANTVTVPTNATIAFPIGSQISIEQNGAGATTIVAAGGVTIRCAHTLVARAQYSVIGLVKTASDTWTCFGDLA